jgi:hypothetical protein
MPSFKAVDVLEEGLLWGCFFTFMVKQPLVESTKDFQDPESAATMI